MRKISYFCLMIVVSIFAFSGCSLSGVKSEEEIIEDLNSDASMYLNIPVDDLTITELEIEKRRTDKEEKFDTVYAYIDAETEYANISCYCTIYYTLYNDGWLLESVVNNEELEIHPKDLPASFADDYMSTNYSIYSYSLVSETYDEDEKRVKYEYDLKKDNETAIINATVSLSFEFQDDLTWSSGNDKFEIVDANLKDNAITEASGYLDGYSDDNIKVSSYKVEEEVNFNNGSDNGSVEFVIQYSVTSEHLYSNEIYNLYLIASPDDNGEYTNFSVGDYYLENHEWKDLTGTYRCVTKDCERCFVEPSELTIHSISFDEQYIDFSVRYSVHVFVGPNDPYETSMDEYNHIIESFSDCDSDISMYSYDAGNITIDIKFDEIMLKRSGTICTLEKVE